MMIVTHFDPQQPSHRGIISGCKGPPIGQQQLPVIKPMDLFLTPEIDQEEEFTELLNNMSDTYLDIDDFELQQLTYLR